MSPAGRALLAARIRAGDVPFLEEPDLERNVARRMALYRDQRRSAPHQGVHQRRRAAGPTWARTPSVLKVEPGLARRVFIPPPSRRGVIQAMAAAGIPVIHLLNVKGLCERYGLPWDPRPLPRPGEGGSQASAPGRVAIPAPLTAAYIALVAAILLAGRRRFPTQP